MPLPALPYLAPPTGHLPVRRRAAEIRTPASASFADLDLREVELLGDRGDAVAQQPASRVEAEAVLEHLRVRQ